MRTLWGLLAAVVSGSTLVVLGPGPAFACSCAGQGPRAYVERTDVIVSGAVLDREDPRQRPWGSSPQRFLVAAETVYKGQVTERFELEAGLPGDTCSMEGIEVDRRYVFFLQETDTVLSGSLCGGTGTVTEEQVRRLLDPVEGQPAGGGPTEASAPGLAMDYAVAAGLAGLLLGGVAWWLRRRRRAWT